MSRFARKYRARDYLPAQKDFIIRLIEHFIPLREG